MIEEHRKILLIEDNPGYVLLTREALKENKKNFDLYVVKDGIEAMSFLRQENKYTDAPHPNLILLDLYLPEKDGYEVLKEIKADDELKRIPVVVLTISKFEEDISKIYELHANCYIIKPINLDQFIRVVKSIQDFWFTIAKLPPKIRGKRRSAK
jgi:chemotaxis family two-component system response regulator Rcp1